MFRSSGRGEAWAAPGRNFEIRGGEIWRGRGRRRGKERGIRLHMQKIMFYKDITSAFVGQFSSFKV